MESISKKLLFRFKVKYLYNNLKKFEKIVNKLNIDYNVNEINNNQLKMFNISVKCNAFDVNQDKQRQCYKQLKCFWPKCRFICNTKHKLKEPNLEYILLIHVFE